jgi:hypothetical protein
MRRAGVVLVVLAIGVSVVASAGGVEPYEAYQSAVAADGPVAQYRFDDAAGSATLADSAGSRTATNNGIALGATGPFAGSKAGSFGGTAYAALPSNPLATATAFSVEAWVRWNGGASYNEPVFDLGSSSTNRLYLTPASSATNHPMTFVIRTSKKTSTVTAATLPAAAWHHVVVTETAAGTITLYLNGAQVAQLTGSSVFPSSLGTITNNWLGRSQVTSDPRLRGSLSNVAFYRSALSTSRVLAHYNASQFPVSTAPPTISGTPQDSQVLTVDRGTWGGLSPISYAYQWIRCDAAGNGCVDIPGAATTTYQATAADIGSALRARVSATNSAGSATATSGPTAPVTARPPVNSQAPTVIGSALDGELLEATSGSWTGTPPLSYAYQWQRCDAAGGACADIASATETSYRLRSADAGRKVRVVVTASNAGGLASQPSATTAVVSAVAPASSAAPAISGTPEDGRTLGASDGDWTGTTPLSFTYRWRRCDSAGGSCADIVGATAATYRQVPDDVGHRIVLVVTASNVAGNASASSAATGVVAPTAPASSAAPQVSGSATVTATLQGGTGAWTGTPTITYAYQWRRCAPDGGSCSDIAGADVADYVVAEADLGSTLRLAVTASNSAGSATSTSAPTAVVGPAEPLWATDQNIGGVVKFLKRGMTRANTQAPLPCDTPICQDLWLKEHQPMPDDAGPRQLRREMWRLRLRAKLVRGIGFLARFAPVAGHAWDAFEVGWRLGNMFMKVEVPPIPAAKLRIHRVQSGGGFTCCMPEGGYLVLPPSPDGDLKVNWHADADADLYSAHWMEWWYPQTITAYDHAYIPPKAYECPPLPSNGGGAGPIEGAQVVTGFIGALGCHGGGDSDPVHAYAITDETVTISSLEDWNGQSATVDDPYGGIDTVPSDEAVEDDARGELDKRCEYGVVRSWLEHQLGGQTANPLAATIPAPQPDELWSDYRQCLAKLGFRDVKRVQIDPADAVLTKPAKAVLDTRPAPGSSVSPDTRIDVVTNPDVISVATQAEVDLANTLDANNTTVNEVNRLDIARSCLRREAAADRDGATECRSLPIFISGQDVREAADHDLEALGVTNDPDLLANAHPAWVLLNYQPAADNPSYTGWYRYRAPCNEPTPPDSDCDEYPFYSSLQGGHLAVPTPSLKYIDRTHNRRQGGKYSAFLTTCTVAPDEAFLAIPVLPGVPADTMAVCN